jgi:hypothetical protein
MGKRPILNIISIHHGDLHIDDRYSSEAFASGTQFNGELRRRLTTRTDGTITINVDAEGKYWISTANLKDNKLVKTASSW